MKQSYATFSSNPTLLGWTAIAFAGLHFALFLASITEPGMDEVEGLSGLPGPIVVFHLSGVALDAILVAGGYCVIVRWRIGAILCLLWTILFTMRAVIRLIFDCRDVLEVAKSSQVTMAIMGPTIMFLLSMVIPILVASMSVPLLRKTSSRPASSDDCVAL